MRDYYSYHPTHRLTRHVLIVGACGSFAIPATSLLSQRTGLPYTEVLRGLEHRAGRGVTEVARTLGPGGFARHERAVLRTAMAEQPHLIAGSDLTLDPWPNRRLLKGAHVVFVRVDLAFLLRRLRQDPMFYKDIARHQPTGVMGEARLGLLLEKINRQAQYAHTTLSGHRSVTSLSDDLRAALLAQGLLVPSTEVAPAVSA